MLEKVEVGADKARRADEGVAVDAPQAGELRLCHARDEAEDPLLLRIGQFCLKPHQVEKRPFPVFRPQLGHRKGLACRFGGQ